VFTVFLDKILRLIDRALHIQGFPLTIYLILVFGVTFILTLISSSITFVNRRRGRSFWFPSSNSTLAIVLVNIVLLLAGISLSVGTFHYSLLAVFSMLTTPISFYILVARKTNNNENTGLRTLALVLAILTIFVFGSRHIINGVEEDETTSDMINIVINGYFRWSIHASHYDLAPLDAILKVMLSYITSDSIFSPILASIMYTCYGLTALLLVYALAKDVAGSFSYALATTLLAMLSYPYSSVIGLSVPSAPHAHLLAVVALTFVMRSLLGYRALTLSDYFVMIPLVIASLLMHPSSLGLVLYLALIALWLVYRKNLAKHSYVLSVLVLSLIIHLAKVMYTAFATGFADYIQLLWDYFVNAFREMEIAAIATRNPGYSGLPRVCLTGFATLLGYLAGLALPILIKTLKRRQLSVVEQIFIVSLLLYGAFTLASLLTGLGGISQSRNLLNGAQPYMELALILYLSMLVPKQGKSYILIPLAISVLATLISPNALPQNYTIPMAAKAATINDHIVAYSFTGLIDKQFFVQLYSTCGGIGRIIALQERGDVSYGLDSTMATVYYFIAPRVVSAKSYWDPCIMAIYAEPRDVTGYVIDKVLDAWVYGLYIYAKR
jgi:hypothetical protein